MYKSEIKNDILTYYEANGIENTCKKYNISKSCLYRWSNPIKAKSYNEQQLAYMKQYIKTNKTIYANSQKEQYIKNKNQRIIRQREYYKTNKNECLLTHKRWVEKNKQHLLEYIKKYYQQGDVRARIKEWRTKNRHRLHHYYLKHYKHKIYLDRKRRALKHKVMEHYTDQDEQYTRNLFNNKCAICGSNNALTIDHWRPLSGGYPLTRKNAVLMCRTCNSIKHDNMPADIYEKCLIESIESKLTNESYAKTN